jgi:hypothetical protein
VCPCLFLCTAGPLVDADAVRFATKLGAHEKKKTLNKAQAQPLHGHDCA